MEVDNGFVKGDFFVKLNLRAHNVSVHTSQIISWAWRCTFVAPPTWESEAGGSGELRSSRSGWVTSTDLIKKESRVTLCMNKRQRRVSVKNLRCVWKGNLDQSLECACHPCVRHVYAHCFLKVMHLSVRDAVLGAGKVVQSVKQRHEFDP